MELIGDPAQFPDPQGDIALSPNLEWLANGYKQDGKVHYVIRHRRTGLTHRAGGYGHFEIVSGDT